MTVILTVQASPIFILQLSDRLVSVSQGSGGPAKPFDALSNKTAVYRANDAIVSIGYTGVAYLGDLPTDEWIAQVLWGEPLPEPGPWGGIPMRIRGKPIVRDIGTAIHKLKSELESLPLKERGPIAITIAGWKLARPKVDVPIVVQLQRSAGQQTINQRRGPTWFQGDF